MNPSKNKKKIVIINWKMFLREKEQLILLKEYEKIGVPSSWIIAPPISYLGSTGKIISNKFNLSSQDISEFDHGGAYTSQTSAHMLEDLCCKYVLIGHQEVRSLTGETISVSIKKSYNAIKHKITPVICISDVSDISGNIFPKDVVIAYEPKDFVSKSSKDVISHDRITNIKSKINSVVLYGGSVNIYTIDKLETYDLDGYLIGSASLDLKFMKYLVSLLK
jgi:triosephosphate isomerase (TIM)